MLAGEGVDAVGTWDTEYGDLTVAVQVVADMDEAIAHIHRYGSNHTESILTTDEAKAERFLREVDAAGVYHNASTRFADGFPLWLWRGGGREHEQDSRARAGGAGWADDVQVSAAG